MHAWHCALALGLTVTGCYANGHYRHGYYYAPGPPAPVGAQPINLGHGVKGSDGSFGWRSKAANVDEAFSHATALVEMHGCAMLSRDAEARADCGGVHVLIRRDPEHLYRLCEADTDRGRCAQTWATISR